MELFLTLLLGILLAANIPPLAKFFSAEEFFSGIQRGLHMGDSWKQGKRGKKK